MKMNLHVPKLKFLAFSTLLISTVEHLNLRKRGGNEIFGESILALRLSLARWGKWDATF